MLPRGSKRGGIREMVGFEERKAERGKMGGGLGGCVAWGPSHRIPCNVSLRTSDRCHWCGNP